MKRNIKNGIVAITMAIALGGSLGGCSGGSGGSQFKKTFGLEPTPPMPLP